MVARSIIPDKAARLDVVMLTKTYALVAGDTDLYQVWRDTLSCSCTAGSFGKPCSHAYAAQLAGVSAMDECPPPPHTSPAHQPPGIRYLAAYDPTSRDFIVLDQHHNAVVDHLPDLLQCERLIQELVARHAQTQNGASHDNT